MLTLESSGSPYKKSEHNLQVRQQVNRSKGAIEFKYQNISAILLDLSLPWIDGYKPAKNVQQLLRTVVVAHIDQHTDTVESIIKGFTNVSKQDNSLQKQGLVREPPPANPINDTAVSPKQYHVRLPRKFDFAEREDRNRKLGHAGEQLVMNYERQRLIDTGRADLADKVKWVAEELGDGAGYDIQSFDEAGNELFIEVKTTNCGALTPFLLSDNELQSSIHYGDQFRLYRVYNFEKAPKFFELKGALSECAILEPQMYRALPKDSTVVKD